MVFALADLEQHTGSLMQYSHGLVPGIRYTEGVLHMAVGAGAHWLIDLIASNQLEPPVRNEPFQVWKLSVSGSRANVLCEDGDGHAVLSREIGFTDFPEPGIVLWFTDGTILLPSEY